MGDKQPTNTKEKQVSYHQQSFLSDDFIIDEILTRLPVKSILRFKSVSKQWYSTLSSSKFATFHLMKFPLFHPSAPVNTLFIESDNNFYLFSDDDDDDDDQIPCKLEDKLVKLEVDFDVENNLNLTGCCNGLVCLSQHKGEYFLLWNPATRKLHKYLSDGYLKSLGGYYIAHGFGYASSDDDYKYVRILTRVLGRGLDSNIIHIFSLAKNKWRKIEFDHVFFPYGKPMLLDEKLYWVSLIEHVGSVIVCFDLGIEKFDIIKLNMLTGFAYLVAMEGRLSDFKYDGTYSSDELKLIQIQGTSITIEKSIDLSKEMRLDGESQMIGYTKTGSFFVAGNSQDVDIDVVEERRLWRKRLWLVDTSMKPMQCTTLLNGDRPINIARYVPSLVSPFPIEES
ncbi:F-box/kelch-repeat protein At3g23880-like [Silene latifolia]|uniref:F-box/kelch-repeat protein At3g23880-like n=1 Tax=Silene latifolia TaxID=37657 RepID=UPI003D76FDC3